MRYCRKLRKLCKIRKRH